MSDKGKAKQGRSLAVQPARDHYQVGYAKPPVSTQFRRGQSGNPRGRPRGSRNKPKLPTLGEERMKTIILEEAYRTIKVNEGPRNVTVPMAQAVIRSMAINAAKGNQRAQRLFTQLLSATERENRRLHEEWLNEAMAYKIYWENELERRRRFNIEAEPPLPHPDDIIVNLKAGSIEIKGPMTKEEKAEWDSLRARLAKCEQSICEGEQLLKSEPDFPYKDQVLENIKHEKRIQEMILSGLGLKR